MDGLKVLFRKVLINCINKDSKVYQTTKLLIFEYIKSVSIILKYFLDVQIDSKATLLIQLSTTLESKYKHLFIYFKQADLHFHYHSIFIHPIKQVFFIMCQYSYSNQTIKIYHLFCSINILSETMLSSIPKIMLFLNSVTNLKSTFI